MEIEGLMGRQNPLKRETRKKRYVDCNGRFLGISRGHGVLLKPFPMGKYHIERTELGTVRFNFVSA